MVAKVTIRDLTDFVICYCNTFGISISPLKLQKLLYYIQSWHLVFFNGHPLFDEEPEAWVNGPVYRTIYDRFKKNWLDEKSLTLGKTSDLDDNLDKHVNKLNLTKDQYDYLCQVLQKYAALSGNQLVYLTHAEPPWNNARIGLRPLDRCTNKITHDSMLKYYETKVVNKNV